ncbi:hypothetical protein [Brucella rhizosphaerae]|uniref:Uncharacterized protein n=1 Tax=Brucella rhizosphaerae TaxID=571254 RepID=A0A256FKY0_9HYPH|nr:hypothetical protein [Brucella rhizosphaerae]OYR15502.1 hypothetical protein CEV32_4777 [Brucella rhizosphaerae]
MKSVFAIFKQVSPETYRPFRIIETYVTSEGMRSRICSGAFSTFDAAQGWVSQLETGSA